MARGFRSGQTAQRQFHPQLESLEQRYLLTAVMGRHIFYNESSFDGNNAAINASDDAAVATGKTALLPGGGQATLANLSNYTRGINGIMLDLTGDVDHSGLTLANVANNFVFKTGASNDPGSWSVLATPPTAVSVRAGAGLSGSDRVEITWADNVIQNTYLEVRILPNSQTGLATTDVSYFAHLMGEVASSTPAGGFARSVAGDRGPIVTNGTQFDVGITNPLDVNRSNSITVAADGGPIATAGTGFLPRISIAAVPPSIDAELANDTGPNGVPNADGMTQDPQIVGTLSSVLSITSFLAGLNAGPVSTDVLGLVQPGGQFTISEALLNSIHGSPLPDGPHTLHLRAENSAGQVTLFDVPFTLKRSIGTPQSPDLIAASDTGASATDNITNDNTPTINVTAELGSVVTLYINGSPVDQAAAGPVAQFTLDTLGDGDYLITARAVDGAGNESSVSGELLLSILTEAPLVEAFTLVTFTDDVTPRVSVNAFGNLGLADGTQVTLDVDLNNDGDFDDPGELGRTVSTLYNGGSRFELTPALPFTDPIDGPYLVQLRARVIDIAGNEGISELSSLKIDTLGSTALYDYVNEPDDSWSASQVFFSTGPGYTYYVLSMRSQTWRVGDVNDPYWDHYLKIVVPNGALADTALLYITGGSNTDGIPTSPDGYMEAIALATSAVTVELRIVPNERVYFFAEPGNPLRNEDEIIAYTFDQFVNNLGAEGNETWPLLLPMVKSAVRAMDTTQEFIPLERPGETIVDFVVTGYSKRGWTTWLTGAVDTRVKAIVPGVIDLLNMDESMQHHYGYYDGAFAPHVHDYQDFHLIQNSFVEANQELGRIVDPYRYLYNSNLTNIPKLVINSTGDEFFVPDSGQFYLSDLPGPAYVRYIPNTGHGLDVRAAESTLTFFDAYLNDRTLPEFSWTAEQDGSIRVQTVTTPTTVRLWQATNFADRDFRRGFNPLIEWTSTILADQGGGVYIGDVDVPDTGARAFMVELTFPSAIPGFPYVFTTEVRVKSNAPITPWPFYMPSNDVVPTLVVSPSTATFGASSGGVSSAAAIATNAIASGLAARAATSDAASELPALFLGAAAEPAVVVEDDEPLALMLAELSWLEEDLEGGNDAISGATDAALDSLADALAD